MPRFRPAPRRLPLLFLLLVIATVSSLTVVSASGDITWTTRAAMPNARFHFGLAIATNGKIYAIGGFDSDSSVPWVEEYDPATDTWEERADMPTPRAALGVVAASNGKIYAIGGGVCNGTQCTDSSAVEEYDPATDSWRGRTRMPTARGNLGVVAASNGKLYAIGGCPGNPCEPTDKVEEYDPETDTWRTRASMPTARGDAGVVAASNGRIYVIGGCPGQNCTGHLTRVEEYDPATDTWRMRGSMPNPRSGLSAVALNNGKIYAIGGYDSSERLARVEVYDIATDTWTTETEMPTPRAVFGLVALANGKLYAVGGETIGEPLDVVEEATVPNVTAPPPPTPTMAAAAAPAKPTVAVSTTSAATPTTAPTATTASAPPTAAPTPAATAATTSATTSADASGFPILPVVLGFVAVGGAAAAGFAVVRTQRRAPASSSPVTASSAPAAPVPEVSSEVPADPTAPLTPSLAAQLGRPASDRSPGTPTPMPPPPQTPAPGQHPAANTPSWPMQQSASTPTPAWQPGVIDSGAERIAYEFQIVGEPKHGGMATVAKAYQPKLDRYVALKTMSPMLAGDPSYVQRFYEEARRTAKLEHPNIVTIYDMGQLPNGSLFITMRYIDGETLQELLARERPLSVERASNIAAQVAAALDYAHQRGIIHRDIKPSNIMIETGDRVTLTDFGIAKLMGDTQLTRTGAVVGTPKYLSPEQALGEPADHRSDIYSLGVVLYEMLVGRAPFEAEAPLAMLNAHISLPPRPLVDLNPQIPLAVQDVVLKALTKDREQRYQTAREFTRALRQALIEGTQAM